MQRLRRRPKSTRDLKPSWNDSKVHHALKLCAGPRASTSVRSQDLQLRHDSCSPRAPQPPKPTAQLAWAGLTSRTPTNACIPVASGCLPLPLPRTPLPATSVHPPACRGPDDPWWQLGGTALRCGPPPRPQRGKKVLVPGAPLGEPPGKVPEWGRSGGSLAST